MLDSRPKGSGFEPHQRHCIVSLRKNINPSLVLVQPRKTRPFITERLLMGRKKSNKQNKQKIIYILSCWKKRLALNMPFLLNMPFCEIADGMMFWLQW